jgi:hypothetical protein
VTWRKQKWQNRNFKPRKKRVSGNVFVRTATIEDPMMKSLTNDGVEKVVFMVLFQGEQLKTRCQYYQRLRLAHH